MQTQLDLCAHKTIPSGEKNHTFLHTYALLYKPEYFHLFSFLPSFVSFSCIYVIYSLIIHSLTISYYAEFH